MTKKCGQHSGFRRSASRSLTRPAKAGAEHQRAVNTRRAIRNAAWAEVAERASMPASIRLPSPIEPATHPLITLPIFSATRRFYAGWPGRKMPSNRSARSGTVLTKTSVGCPPLTDCARNIGPVQIHRRLAGIPSFHRPDAPRTHPIPEWLLRRSSLARLSIASFRTFAARQKKRLLPSMSRSSSTNDGEPTAVLSEFGAEIAITTAAARRSRVGRAIAGCEKNWSSASLPRCTSMLHSRRRRSG